MTKLEMMKRTDAARYYNEKQLNHCTCWIREATDPVTGEIITIIRSYRTNVAVMYETGNEKRLYVFDYYSATTSKHIGKFIKEYKPDVVIYLYQRSDRLVEVDITGGIYTKSSAKSRKTDIRTDYETVIYEM